MACARVSAALHGGDADQRAAAYAELTALASGNSPDVTIGLSGATINIEGLAVGGEGEGNRWRSHALIRSRMGLNQQMGGVERARGIVGVPTP